jgi:cation:H+ antiporter
VLPQILVFFAGLAGLVYGADVFVKGAASLALRLGVSRLVIGMTVVGFGTSLPELSVNLSAAFSGRLDLAVGNVVGSNIANIGLILGIAALVAPLTIHVSLLKLEIPLLLLVSAGLWLLGSNGQLGRPDGALLLLGFVGLLLLIGYGGRQEPRQIEADIVDGGVPSSVDATRATWRDLAWIGVGFVLLLVASRLMVGAAVDLARLWGMSELVIGLTIVAIGTSLPELAASTLAALRGETDIAIGNVLGSNLFNILLILGVTAVITPLPLDPTLIRVQIPVMILFAALLYPLSLRGRSIGRPAAAVGVLWLSGLAAHVDRLTPIGSVFIALAGNRRRLGGRVAGHGRARHDMGADRGGQEQKQGDQDLSQPQAVAQQAVVQNRGQQDAADAQRGRLGRPMQALEKVRQFRQADGTDQREKSADQKQYSDQNLDRASAAHSMMSRRMTYLDKATVPTKPSMAITRAASK